MCKMTWDKWYSLSKIKLLPLIIIILVSVGCNSNKSINQQIDRIVKANIDDEKQLSYDLSMELINDYSGAYSDFKGYYNIALLYNQMSNHSKALEYLMLADTVISDEVSTQEKVDFEILYAVTLDKLQNYHGTVYLEEIIRRYNEVIAVILEEDNNSNELESYYKPVFCNIFDALIESSNYSEFERVYDIARKSGIDNSWLYLYGVEAAIATDDIQKVDDILHTMKRIYPDAEDTKVAEVNYYIASKQFNKAIEMIVYEKQIADALGTGFSEYVYYYDVAWYFEQAGDISLAKENYQKAAQASIHHVLRYPLKNALDRLDIDYTEIIDQLNDELRDLEKNIFNGDESE